MFTIRKSYTVEYAHQLKSAFTECCHETIHGHSGKIEIFLSSEDLNEDQMVVDFGKVSSLFKNYIMNTYDHALIIPYNLDKKYINCLKKYNKKLLITGGNPTAEFFCEKIYSDLNMILMNHKIGKMLYIPRIRFHETDSGYAEFTRESLLF
jgi:6-pyruvoyltetrahydropterin/6-carboxytetrahydropterin synthase